METPLPPSRGWKHPSVLAHFAALVTSIGALAASFQACSRPPPPEEKADRVYETLRERVEEQAEAQRQQGQDLRDLRAWLRGYFQATGVRIPDPPGTAPAAPVRVVLEPAPAGSSAPMVAAPKRPGRPPEPQGVRVLTPLPAPRPVTSGAALPANADAL